MLTARRDLPQLLRLAIVSGVVLFGTVFGLWALGVQLTGLATTLAMEIVLIYALITRAFWTPFMFGVLAVAGGLMVASAFMAALSAQELGLWFLGLLVLTVGDVVNVRRVKRSRV